MKNARIMLARIMLARIMLASMQGMYGHH